jgi:putative transposase
VAGFIVAQRDLHGVPHASACRALGVSQAWFYKWRHGDTSPRRARRQQLAIEIRRLYAVHRGRYGAPRITGDLRDGGWRVSENTVAGIMRQLGLVGRPTRRRRGLTRPGKGRWRAPDLVGRDFAAAGINHKWYGDGTEIRTDEGRLYLDSVLDMGSRRIVGFALGAHHDTALAYAALAMAVAVRGGAAAVAGVILHTDQGSESTPLVCSGPRVSASASTSRWAGPAPRWTTRSSKHGTRPWSSSSAASSTSPPRPTPAEPSRRGSTTTTATGATPPSG